MKSQKVATRYTLKFTIFILVWIFNLPLINAQESYSTEEQLGQATIRIIVSQGKNYYTGTGFFFRFKKNNITKNVLITNKHVVAGMEKTYLNFNRQISGRPNYGDLIKYTIDSTLLKWVPHPDTAIDLSILDLDVIEQNANKKGTPIFIRAIDESLIPNDSIWDTFSYLEEVIMVGYPNGIIDKKNNLPVIRRGTTASQPRLNFNDKEEFLTDISTFHGSSGSPIFIRRIPYGLKNVGLNSMSIGKSPQYYFVGIHYQSEYFNIILGKVDKIQLEQLDSSSVQKFQIPLNLGYVIKSKKILDFKNLIFKNLMK